MWGTTLSAPSGAAELSAFGMVNGTIVTGGAASLWARQSVGNVEVNSSGGSAEVVVLSDAIVLDVDAAGGDATVIALGALQGITKATGDVFAYSLGMFDQAIIAGGSARAVSFGTMTVLASVAEDLDLGSIGPMVVTATAASGKLVSYSDINAVLVNIDQIDRIWARGDVTGTYLADRIYEVTAYGQVTATMDATDSLWGLRALGDIAGTFTAGVAIGDVRTGGTADLAVFVAPSVPGVVEGTRAGFMTYPEAPLPRVGEFFADAADAYREVLAAQEDLQAAGTALVQQTTAAIGEVGRAISQAGARLLEIYAEAGGRMDNAKALQQQRFEDAQRDIQREFAKAGVEYEKAQRGVDNAVDLAFKQAQRPIDDRNAELSTGSRQAAHEKAFHQQVSASMVQSKADEHTATTLQLTVDQGLRPDRWNQEMREMGNQMLDNLQLALDIAGTADPDADQRQNAATADRCEQTGAATPGAPAAALHLHVEPS